MDLAWQVMAYGSGGPEQCLSAHVAADQAAEHDLWAADHDALAWIQRYLGCFVSGSTVGWTAILVRFYSLLSF